MHYEKLENGTVCSAQGFEAAGIIAGLKESGKEDMAVIYSATACQFAGSYTQNAFAAAPVVYCKQVHKNSKTIHACIINSGNANACTGRQGWTNASHMAADTADLLNIDPSEVLVFSTGRIGVPLPMEIVKAGIKKCCEARNATGGAKAAEAIMTTDTVAKSIAVKIDIDGTDVIIGGMSKGAGMIAPKMKTAEKEATMLAYITTDVLLEEGLLSEILDQSLNQSFNRITIDGDTSTNDSFICMANGLAGNSMIRRGSAEAAKFQEAFNYVAAELARMLILDAEGATRFVEVKVVGAENDGDAETCAKAIANSLLCKTAWFGADPNWGRSLDAAGYSGVNINTGEFNLYYSGVQVVKSGQDAGLSEDEMYKLINRDEIFLEVDLGLVDGEYTAWTCDLSYEYVKINAEYRT